MCYKKREYYTFVYKILRYGTLGTYVRKTCLMCMYNVYLYSGITFAQSKYSLN